MTQLTRRLRWPDLFLAAYVALIGALLFAVPAHSATHCRGTNGRFIKCPAPAPTPVPTPTPTPTPTPAPVPTPTTFGADVLSEGDSISQFYGGSHTGIYAAANPGVRFVGNAVGGSGLGDAAEASTGNDLYPRQAADLAVHAKILTVLIGANNIGALNNGNYEYVTAQAYADALFAYLAPFRAAGTKVAVGTILPQCISGNPPLFTGDPETGLNLKSNTNRAAFNQIIRAAVGTKIDAVYDFAADPVMGPDAAACNTTLYKDGLHPTDFGAGSGQSKIEVIYAATVNALLSGTPVPPPPAPAPAVDNPMVGQSLGVGAPDIATTDHDVMNDLIGGQPIPRSASTGSPIDTGNFRFVCFHTTLANDDPTVFPGQPGASHTHDQTGVDNWNAFSNYGNLRVSGGGSNCNFVAGADGINQPVSSVPAAEKNWSANRTPYWQPALLDGLGNVRLADLIELYYKRMPITAPACSGWKLAPDPAKSEGQCVPLPNGLKFLFGADMAHPTVVPAVAFTYDCVFADGSQHLSTFHGALSTCQAQAASTGQPQTFIIRGEAPSCWDGVHLDTADHRSHLAYADYSNGYGYQQCPKDHPFVIPSFTYQSWYSVRGSDDTSKFKLSCSAMYGNPDDGACMHVDYGPMAWDPKVYRMIEDNCFNKMLDSNGGDLCNGYRLKGAAQPIYNINGVYSYAWRNPVSTVPVPSP